MKRKLFLIIVCFFCFFNSQYRGSLNSIIFDGNTYSDRLPKDYIFLSKDLDKISNNIYFQDLQHSESRTSDFMSMILILNRDFTFNFLNTNLKLEIIANKNQTEKLPISIENIWYANHEIDLEAYNPLDNWSNFLLSLQYLNISDEKAVECFFNKYESKKQIKKKTYNSGLSVYSEAEQKEDAEKFKLSLKSFISKINKENNLKIDLNNIEKSKNPFNEICSEIKKQNSNNECVNALFSTYIKNDDGYALDGFLLDSSGKDLNEIASQFFFPRGNVNFGDKKLKMILPKDIFFNETNKKSDVYFVIEKIEYQLTYDFNKETYCLKVKIIPFSNSISSNFTFIGKDFNRGYNYKGKNDEIFVEKDNLKELELLIYPFEIQTKVKFITKDEVYSNMFSQEIILKHIFKLK